jgi:L-asparagine transporter-like permease
VLLISIIKFIHLVFAVSLLASTFVCLALVGSRKFSFLPTANKDRITQLKKFMLFTCLLMLTTGSLLVLPKHYTFHTPWIIAAYILVTVYILTVIVLLRFKHKRAVTHIDEKISPGQRWLWRLAYLLLLAVLAGLIHDAVTKQTFLF